MLTLTMNDMWRSLDRMMSPEAFRAPVAGPRFVAKRTEDGLELKAELPGVSPDAVTIHAEGTRLTVEAERATEAPEGFTALRKERAAGRFTRTFELSEALDAASTQARFDHGILTLTIARRPERAPKRIPVQVG